MTLPLQCRDIGEQLSKKVASDKRDNRQYLATKGFVKPLILISAADKV